MLRGDVTISTIYLSCVKIMSVKLHSEYRILWASLCASFALFSQKLREWQHLSAYFLNTPRTCKSSLGVQVVMLVFFVLHWLVSNYYDHMLLSFSALGLDNMEKGASIKPCQVEIYCTHLKCIGTILNIGKGSY